MRGRSTTVSISFAIALVAGRKRVPNPATGRTALRSGLITDQRSSNLTGLLSCLSAARVKAHAELATFSATIAQSSPQQGIARLVQPAGQPVRAAIVRVRHAHEPFMCVTDVCFVGAGL